MANHPIDDVVIDNVDVDKAGFRAMVKSRLPIRLADVAEVQATKLASQLRIYVASLKCNYELDAADTTTAHNGTSCLVSLDGGRFKPVDVALGANLLPLVSDGAALGSSSKMFSDLFLASGAVINFNAGNVTVTHSANSLAVGAQQVQFGVGGASVSSSLMFNGASGVSTGFYHQWNKAGTGKWQQGFVVGTADDMAFYKVGSGAYAFRLSYSDESVSIGSAAAASSKITGALKIAGGLGVTGDIYGNDIYATRSSTQGLLALDSSGSRYIFNDGSVFQIVGRPVTITNNTAAISKTSGSLVVAGGIGAGGAIFGSNLYGDTVLGTSPTGGIGYNAGAGGAVTQATSRTQGVTLNKVCGQITTNNANLAAGAAATFTVTNSAVAATDVPMVAVKSGQTNKETKAYVSAVAAGSFDITVHNQHPSTVEVGAIVIDFSIIKAVNN